MFFNMLYLTASTTAAEPIAENAHTHEIPIPDGTTSSVAPEEPQQKSTRVNFTVEGLNDGVLSFHKLNENGSYDEVRRIIGAVGRRDATICSKVTEQLQLFMNAIQDPYNTSTTWKHRLLPIATVFSVACFAVSFFVYLFLTKVNAGKGTVIESNDVEGKSAALSVGFTCTSIPLIVTYALYRGTCCTRGLRDKAVENELKKVWNACPESLRPLVAQGAKIMLDDVGLSKPLEGIYEELNTFISNQQPVSLDTTTTS